MEQFRHFVHILIPLMPQRVPLDVFVLIAPHGVILFLDAISKRISSGCGREQRGFPFALLLTVGFPPVFDMGGIFEECKNNIFSIEEIMDQEIPFQQIQPSIYSVCIYLALKYNNVKVDLYLERSEASRVTTGSIQSYPSSCSFVYRGPPRAIF